MFFYFAEVNKQGIQLILWNSHSIVFYDNVKANINNFSSVFFIRNTRWKPVWWFAVMNFVFIQLLLLKWWLRPKEVSWLIRRHIVWVFSNQTAALTWRLCHLCFVKIKRNCDLTTSWTKLYCVWNEIYKYLEYSALVNKQLLVIRSLNSICLFEY